MKSSEDDLPSRSTCLERLYIYSNLGICQMLRLVFVRSHRSKRLPQTGGTILSSAKMLGESVQLHCYRLATSLCVYRDAARTSLPRSARRSAGRLTRIPIQQRRIFPCLSISFPDNSLPFPRWRLPLALFLQLLRCAG
jgi:hypothetical protein